MHLLTCKPLTGEGGLAAEGRGGPTAAAEHSVIIKPHINLLTGEGGRAAEGRGGPTAAAEHSGLRAPQRQH